MRNYFTWVGYGLISISTVCNKQDKEIKKSKILKFLGGAPWPPEEPGHLVNVTTTYVLNTTADLTMLFQGTESSDFSLISDFFFQLSGPFLRSI